MAFNVTAVGIRPHESVYYESEERPYWEINGDGRADVYTGNMENIATHMPGTFSAIIVEPVAEDEDTTPFTKDDVFPTPPS